MCFTSMNRTFHLKNIIKYDLTEKKKELKVAMKVQKEKDSMQFSLTQGKDKTYTQVYN